MSAFDSLCAEIGVRSSAILELLDHVDQFDDESVEAAIRTGIVRFGRSLAADAPVLARAFAEDRDAAIDAGLPLYGSKVKSDRYGYGTVLATYRNSGSLKGWYIRARFGTGIVAVRPSDLKWVGGIQRRAA